ncbi:UDP-N-acetyl-D-glucosamine dehydrogenase [Listeria newyorkensis]|uniref:UDP-N-acetyl-D-glucosamine dehydrogenase n=1 Tax=Listeria newyorkensis TaxID=1497681 RepID=A0ABX4XL59_9LIST|nr:nucleotide sugar dehydrogenase [Listeria newyorkensis]KGL46592.1 UDP-N-acetyl-D-glucosamine dehydrogenase [Listeria newyorkensis]PNP91065.1 UDP-N-acetyl-D-glucosamine dehydrogenase [Listeria newyorkensis]WAO20851.1 nucleotide sugar dehydrogenase [Listeria newyorkensis]SQC56294.1 UDP-glucose 6-dehydrogenase tuaD [Listeria newyorkensis]
MNNFKKIKNSLNEKEAVIAVMGLGYVGLPLAISFAEAGFQVIGFDPSEPKVTLVNQGKSDIMDITSERLSKLIGKKRLVATTDSESLAKADAIIICVPTPLTKSYEPDISYIVSAVDMIRANMTPNTVVVLESTTYPGTSKELLYAPIEKDGWKLDEDFYVCYSPERVDPGNKTYQTENTPKVLGGMTPISMQVGTALYEQVIDYVVPVASTEVAEMSKLLENTFRSINIAFINEMSLLCEKLDIDVWETIEASSTKPFGFMRFNPGPGIGGHCIPLDPIYLSWKAKEVNFFSRFIELAQETNHQMPEHVVHKAMKTLNSKQKALSGSRVLLLGMAYKENIDDLRESPSISVYENLVKAGASVDFCDPLATKYRDYDGTIQETIPLDYSSFASYDLVIMLTCHDLFDKEQILANSALILDTKNVMSSFGSSKVTRFGGGPVIDVEKSLMAQ